MTEERLVGILIGIYPNPPDLTGPMVLQAMKQSVNEALDEAANEVLAVLGNGWTPNDDDILNLKVK